MQYSPGEWEVFRASTLLKGSFCDQKLTDCQIHQLTFPLVVCHISQNALDRPKGSPSDQKDPIEK